MSSVRVEKILKAISELSHAEQIELARDLPLVLESGSEIGRLSTEAVRQAIATRESIRRRFDATGQLPGSVDQDLDAVRDDRLDELMDDNQTQDQVV
jgi:hypothetical protein